MESDEHRFSLDDRGQLFDARNDLLMPPVNSIERTDGDHRVGEFGKIIEVVKHFHGPANIPVPYRFPNPCNPYLPSFVCTFVILVPERPARVLFREK